MSKFLTPPVWYDKNGNLNQMLIGDARNTTSSLQSNISIGESSLAGAVDGVGGSLSIGYGAKAKSDQTIVVGAFSDASDGGIAIGHGISVVGGGIGIGGSATANQIQLGNPSSMYDLKIGNGYGSTVNCGEILTNNIKINAGIASINSAGKVVAEDIMAKEIYGNNFISCPLLRISSSPIKKTDFSPVSDSTKKYSVTLPDGEYENVIFLIVIMVTHFESGTSGNYYRQHFGLMSSFKSSENDIGTPDTTINIPIITKVNNSPYDNSWADAILDFSPQTSNTLYCDFSNVMGGNDQDITKATMYIYKMAKFSPLLQN